jgi:hypothetical protein
MHDIADRLLNTGLVQFGRFGPDYEPLKLNVSLLPSYPAVLSLIADYAGAILDPLSFDRLVCTADSVPLGTAISLQTGKPLVYSLGTDAPGVHDLIGAYDVGHPAVLLLNVWDGETMLGDLLPKAARVGLDIHHIIPIFDRAPAQAAGVLVQPMLRLRPLIQQMVDMGRVPAGAAHQVGQWLDANASLSG